MGMGFDEALKAAKAEERVRILAILEEIDVERGADGKKGCFVNTATLRNLILNGVPK